MRSVTEWQVGDVAMVTDPTLGERVMIHLGHDPAHRCWHGAYDSGDVRCLDHSQTLDIRRLVVIDPEDREQVERLAAAYATTESSRSGDEYRAWDNRSVEARGRIVDTMQAALREFANPTPPKMQEPSGVGAVIETERGEKWVRCSTDEWRISDGSAFSVKWSSLVVDAVRVLSEGVPA